MKSIQNLKFIERSSLLDWEEVLDLKGSILWEIWAVDSVHFSAVAKFGSYGIWSQALSDLRIHWAAELSEFVYDILLSNFHNDARACGHLLDHANKLREYTLIYLEEFLGRWHVEREHLHWRNFIAFLEDHINDSSGVALLDSVRLDDAAGAVIESSCWRELLWKVKLRFFGEVALVSGSVDSISHSIRSKSSSQGVWGISLSVLRVGWAKSRSQRVDSIVLDELHSSDNLWLHVGA